MPTLCVLPVSWTGSQVIGPGVSVFHCQTGDQDAVISGAATFFTAIKDLFSAGLQWSFPTGGDTIDEATGQVNGSYVAATHTPVVSTGTGTWAAGVGARAKWSTIGIVNGRRVVGSTFLVPLSVNQFEGAGNITSSALSTLQGAASAFAALPAGIRIYSRKTAEHAGISYPLVSATVPDRISWLRSRRT